MRALFGTDGTFNATHGSDSTKSAAREIKFYFPNLILEPLLEPSTAQHYITTNLHPALSKALTALAREKPSAEKFEAITFLAQFLLANNPNKPRIITPDAWDPADEEDDDEAEFLNAKMRVDSAEGDVPAVVVPAVQAYQPLTPTTDETANSGRSLSRQSSQQGRSRPGTMSGTSPMGEQKPISAPEVGFCWTLSGSVFPFLRFAQKPVQRPLSYFHLFSDQHLTESFAGGDMLVRMLQGCLS